MKSRVLKAAVALILQAVSVLGIGTLLLFLTLSVEAPLGGTLYDVVMWALIPLLGLGSAWLCVRLGAPYGVAWILPPLCQVAAQWLLTGVVPTSPGMPMVTLLLSAFGASAGYEQMRRMNKRKKK